MQIRRKNLQHYAQAIELHQKYGYGSRKISYIIPVHDRTIRRWFTKFAQENAQQSDLMNRKKKACKKPQKAIKPIVVDSENSSSEELTRLRKALAQAQARTQQLQEEIKSLAQAAATAQQLREEIKRLRAAQAHTSAKEVNRLNKALEFEYIRAEAFKKMIDVAESTFNIPILKKRGTK